MMIDKIGILNPLNNLQNTRKTDSSAKSVSNSDSVHISKDAMQLAEAYYLDKVAEETPNVRADRIAEVKAKIKDPSYLSDAVIMSAAEGIMTSFGL